MADRTYWFARYRVNPAGRGLVAIAWQGRAVIAGFVGGMVLGAVLFALLGLWAQNFALGVVVFALCAIASASTFVWAAVSKSDPVHSVADYQAGRVAIRTTGTGA